ncbi:hypothetical protein [Deinococcus xianganensis]|uniref:Uncharacterized protein n=1 Tax=Deinococcus xianganensis TaxID=1507289 RepID=A0A6I4YD76_9DEIO|nr:hypothetical protein [Deinococcus xianganensis]MXV19442.1 hypothetical protein [Deinococcus xianganensis]
MTPHLAAQRPPHVTALWVSVTTFCLLPLFTPNRLVTLVLLAVLVPFTLRLTRWMTALHSGHEATPHTRALNIWALHGVALGLIWVGVGLWQQRSGWMPDGAVQGLMGAALACTSWAFRSALDRPSGPPTDATLARWSWSLRVWQVALLVDLVWIALRGPLTPPMLQPLALFLAAELLHRFVQGRAR